MDPIKVRDVLKLIAERGWYLSTQKGSHRQFKHPTLAGKVTIAGHTSAEMDEGTLKSILRQMGVKP